MMLRTPMRMEETIITTRTTSLLKIEVKFSVSTVATMDIMPTSAQKVILKGTKGTSMMQ
jgi:hypothetical protein